VNEQPAAKRILKSCEQGYIEGLLGVDQAIKGTLKALFPFSHQAAADQPEQTRAGLVYAVSGVLCHG
jgi:hypothetical protein